jgi:hypothetical protein
MATGRRARRLWKYLDSKVAAAFTRLFESSGPYVRISAQCAS